VNNPSAYKATMPSSSLPFWLRSVMDFLGPCVPATEYSTESLEAPRRTERLGIFGADSTRSQHNLVFPSNTFCERPRLYVSLG